jgi:site-specific recombinase XerD
MIELVTDGLNSKQTIRAYTRALGDFFDWLQEDSGPLTKATVTRYRMSLVQSGVGAASINQRLSAIRKLGQEAMDNALIPSQIGSGILNVPGVKQQGKRLGFWMTKEQVNHMLSLPGDDLMGLRDKAILSILISAGLRRAECASLEVRQLQERSGHPVLVDIIGKGNKIRSVPCITWTFDAVYDWLDAAGIEDGYVFRGVYKSRKRIRKTGITPQAVYLIIRKYSEMMPDVSLATHDMRRTYARLAHDGGAPIVQIQLAMGHKSLKTTEIYLGIQQDLENSPASFIGLGNLEEKPD